ncbi:MAG TPA: hypothetical protein VHL11_13665, partial [Phototrophicaceae bacterium]|nr:hypothetical protein [Phototrophicaceae bacterium]
MRNLNTMLHEADAALLPILAKRWGVIAQGTTPEELIQALIGAMLEPGRAEKIYDALDDKQRGALLALNGFKDRAMPALMFEKMFGEIRLMGAGKIEREKPHERPASIGEALYYRGLIGKGNDKVGAGIGPVIYIPDDLAKVLPTHKTGYSAGALGEYQAEDEPADQASSGEVHVLPIEEVENVRQADTSLVDDMTTLLAFLQLQSPSIDTEYHLEDELRTTVSHHLLVHDEARIAFMIGIGITAELVEVQSGKVYPRRAEVRRWLSEKRSAQLKLLVDAWVKSLEYRELWHTPGLLPEAGWTYDPAVARQAVLTLFGQVAPKNDWWALDDFIDAVKVKNPNFQRPGGDFESWYIRNEEGDYLKGLDSWDAVEGAVLSFYFFAPMHWLGLADLAEDAVRLTAYGRALIDNQTWPQPPETEDKITVQPDGTLIASRKVPRLDRFQMARFTTWIHPATLKGDPYTYRLDAPGIQRASDQAITTEHIGAFIKRVLDGGAVPPPMAKLLETWRSG